MGGIDNSFKTLISLAVGMPLVDQVIKGAIEAPATYDRVSGNRAKREAKDATDAATAAANKLAGQQADLQRQQQETSTNSQSVIDAKNRQRAAMAGAGGRGSTILTSPLGVVTPSQTTDKQLLGM